MALNATTLGTDIGTALFNTLDGVLKEMLRPLGVQIPPGHLIEDRRALDAIGNAIANAVVDHLKNHAEVAIPTLDVKRSGVTIAQTTATTGHYLK